MHFGFCSIYDITMNRTYTYNSNFECLFVEEYLIILPFEMRVPCHTIVMICNNNRHNFNYFICAAI